MTELDAALIAAHEAGDRAALVTLYAQAADETASEEASAFYLTHAFIFALETGDLRAEKLRAALKSRGRI